MDVAATTAWSRCLARLWRFIRAALLTLLVLTLVSLGTGWLILYASLPTLQGARSVASLSANVEVMRDKLGVPTVTGTSRADVALATGWLHAQDRFFQMDLMRRAAAGELSALVGTAAVDADRAVRVHQFRAVAREVVEQLPPQQRRVLEAYTEGVNAGLSKLRSRPFEYWLLRSRPQSWRAEDSVLVMLAMFLQLQESDGHYEIQRGLLAKLPAPLFQFLSAGAPEWEATLDGSRTPQPVLPSPEQLDLRHSTVASLRDATSDSERYGLGGSNNWALDGKHTSHGSALIANDMHLGLSIPNTWYHLRLVVKSARAGALDITGVSLPGTPAIVAGSNGRIAWGITNSLGDFSDVVLLEPDPQDAHRYLVPGGSEPLRTRLETIEVHGGPPVQLEVLQSRWGPVIGRDVHQRLIALDWVAHKPEALNFGILALEIVSSVPEALQAAAHAGTPALNLIVADSAGHIGWTILGRIPRHLSEDPSVPHRSSDTNTGLRGWVAEEDQPRVLDPADGLLWTANARVAGGVTASLLGDGGFDRGSRAKQILSDLNALPGPVTAAQCLNIQLDDRALFLERWRELLTGLLDSASLEAHPTRAAMKSLLTHWSGKAAVPDAAYRLVRDFRSTVERRTFQVWVAPAQSAAPDFQFRIPASFEGPLWRLVSDRPAHLLPPGYETWPAFLLQAADEAAANLTRECGDLASCTWGRRNTVRISHPLGALPVLGSLLNMPVVSLPGDDDMPRVQGRGYGASERFAVSPGHESEGYFEMPGGQSGHPLSPFYRAGHEAWVNGTRESFLPGPAAHTLLLTPQQEQLPTTRPANPSSVQGAGG